MRRFRCRAPHAHDWLLLVGALFVLATPLFVEWLGPLLPVPAPRVGPDPAEIILRPEDLDGWTPASTTRSALRSELGTVISDEYRASFVRVTTDGIPHSVLATVRVYPRHSSDGSSMTGAEHVRHMAGVAEQNPHAVRYEVPDLGEVAFGLSAPPSHPSPWASDFTRIVVGLRNLMVELTVGNRSRADLSADAIHQLTRIMVERAESAPEAQVFDWNLPLAGSPRPWSYLLSQTDVGPGVHLGGQFLQLPGSHWKRQSGPVVEYEMPARSDRSRLQAENTFVTSGRRLTATVQVYATAEAATAAVDERIRQWGDQRVEVVPLGEQAAAMWSGIVPGSEAATASFGTAGYTACDVWVRRGAIVTRVMLDGAPPGVSLDEALAFAKQADGKLPNR